MPAPVSVSLPRTSREYLKGQKPRPNGRLRAPVRLFVKPPTNHVGNKLRLLHKILPELGDLADHTFVDLFAGGMSVGLNVDAIRVLFNDAHPVVADVSRLFSESAPDQVEAEMAELVTKYGFSDSVANGYGFYGSTSSQGLVAHNRAPFEKLRDDWSTGAFSGHARRSSSSR